MLILCLWLRTRAINFWHSCSRVKSEQNHLAVEIRDQRHYWSSSQNQWTSWWRHWHHVSRFSSDASNPTRPNLRWYLIDNLFIDSWCTLVCWKQLRSERLVTLSDMISTILPVDTTFAVEIYGTIPTSLHGKSVEKFYPRSCQKKIGRSDTQKCSWKDLVTIITLLNVKRLVLFRCVLVNRRNTYYFIINLIF